MPKFKVTATVDMEYEGIIEAPNEEAAWNIAADSSGDGTVNWVQVDEQDWNLEKIVRTNNV